MIRAINRLDLDQIQIWIELVCWYSEAPCGISEKVIVGRYFSMLAMTDDLQVLYLVLPGSIW